MSHKEKYQEESSVDVLEAPVNEIVVYNDDFNTFDHVIETLIKTCGHNHIQAEQCSMIVHYKGKCGVKSGDMDDLMPRCEAILEAGITAEIV